MKLFTIAQGWQGCCERRLLVFDCLVYFHPTKLCAFGCAEGLRTKSVLCNLTVTQAKELDRLVTAGEAYSAFSYICALKGV